MTAIIVPCPHCSKSAQLESDSLPDKPAYFACPSCKQKVVVDKRKLLGQELQQPRIVLLLLEELEILTTPPRGQISHDLFGLLTSLSVELTCLQVFIPEYLGDTIGEVFDGLVVQ